MSDAPTVHDVVEFLQGVQSPRTELDLFQAAEGGSTPYGRLLSCANRLQSAWSAWVQTGEITPRQARLQAEICRLIPICQHLLAQIDGDLRNEGTQHRLRVAAHVARAEELLADDVMSLTRPSPATIRYLRRLPTLDRLELWKRFSENPQAFALDVFRRPSAGEDLAGVRSLNPEDFERSLNLLSDIPKPEALPE